MNAPLRALTRALVRVAACATLVAAPWVCSAQAWPSRTIRIVAPVPPGGGVDFLARAVAQKLQAAFDVPVIVENKAGASALVGTNFVAKAAPDGYTLLMGYSVLATNKFLVDELPYDLDRDLTPLVYVGYIPLILVTPTDFPPNSVGELIALLKANPDKYVYASGGAGAGAHLAAEMFKVSTGTQMKQVPYKGNAPALVDVVGGHVPIMFDTITTSLPLVRGGKLKALATTGPKRSPLAPDLPTMIEAGVPGFEISAWYMMFAPKKTPPEILDKINRAIEKSFEDPEFVKQLASQGIVVTGGTRDQASTFLNSEVARWGKLIKTQGIKAD